MARKRLENRNVRKLSKTGGGKSISVTLPIEMVRQLRWREHQRVVVRKSGSKLVIEDWKK